MKTLKVYNTEDQIIGVASVYAERPHEIMFTYCNLNRDYVELEKIDGVKLEGSDNIWHMQYGVHYSSDKVSILENGSFYRK